MRESPSARTPPRCCCCRVYTRHSRRAGVGAVATATAASVDGVRCRSFSATASSTVRRGREYRRESGLSASLCIWQLGQDARRDSVQEAQCCTATGAV